MSLKLLVSIRSEPLTLLGTPQHTQTKRRHKAPHTSTQPSEEHADIQVLAHTSGARKRVQMWFIKAPSRCRCCTTTKTETALSEICSMYEDVSPCQNV